MVMALIRQRSMLALENNALCVVILCSGCPTLLSVSGVSCIMLGCLGPPAVALHVRQTRNADMERRLECSIP